MSQPAKAKCPVCKKPTNPDIKPFCCDRCKQVDLGRWFKGSYVVPGRSGDAGSGLPEDIDN